jgi:ribosome maturation factor RimP
VLESIREVVVPVVDALNLKIVDIEYKEAGPRSILRIFIDKPGGVTIDDCVEASREINVRLDVHDLIPHKYTLEISSPGLTRKLKTVKDFEESVGRRVKIITKRGCFIGRLADFREGVAEIVGGERSERVGFDEIERANLELDPAIWSGRLKKAKREE